jgi:hypothetical protein
MNCGELQSLPEDNVRNAGRLQIKQNKTKDKKLSGTSEVDSCTVGKIILYEF